MAVSIIVGGQFGSEGKGKVAAITARLQGAAAVVRVGGPNSGHTPDDPGRGVLQQLPTAAYDSEVVCVLPPGSYISPAILSAEIESTGLTPDRLKIDPLASIITSEDRSAEAAIGITDRIGSTGSGTGAAVWRRVLRGETAALARDIPELTPYLADTALYLRELADKHRRIVIEGTQGFGLSLLHSRDYPYATSRDTTAAGALSETGLSPLDVDTVILVLRAFPIRVAGQSGPLADETTWEALTREGGHDHDLLERTTVTKRIRRVAHFHPGLVRRALAANRPTSVVMNHLDYLDHQICLTGVLGKEAQQFLSRVQDSIGQRVDKVGVGPTSLIDRWSTSQPLVVSARDSH